MIDYASRQRASRKHVIGLTAVVVLHGLLFWAINSGLARKFVKVIKGPVEAVLLEETKPEIPPPPPPPPPKNLPPPPPSYVPPVDIQVAAPTPVNAIAAVSTHRSLWRRLPPYLCKQHQRHLHLPCKLLP
jgi:protein TonB